MTCNHEKFLESTELECRRIAKSCNEGTQGAQEWLKTAEALLQRRREHIQVCKKCGGKQ
jgi:hypothetical protein